MSDTPEFEHWTGLPAEVLNAARELDLAIEEYGNGWHEDAETQKDYSRVLQARMNFAKFSRTRAGQEVFLRRGTYELRSLEARYAALSKENRELREALEFYADPETYLAIGFLPDPPCGDFMDDWSDTGEEYGFRPGKTARESLNTERDSR